VPTCRSRSAASPARERELGELQHLLGSTRLLTLVGPGGIGKTRLALAVAELADREAAFVDLAAVERPAVVSDAVAAALGVVDRPGQELPATLAEVLSRRALLLVLDNCEHVVDAAAELALDLLQARDRAACSPCAGGVRDRAQAASSSARGRGRRTVRLPRKRLAGTRRQRGQRLIEPRSD
jgi:hypothetical protein